VRFFAPVIALWALPLLALFVVLPQAADIEEQAVRDPLPATVVVGERERNYIQEAVLVFDLAPSAPVAVQVDGLVTSLHVASGDEITQGRDLVSLDGVKLRAHLGAQPFYRELGEGAKGSDVAELSAYLAATGHANTLGRDNAFSASMTKAVKAYQKSVGAAETGIFTPGLTIYVPPGVAQVRQVGATVGARLAAGDALLTGPDRPTSLAVEKSGEAPLRVLGLPGPFIAHLRATQLPLTSLTPEAPEVDALYTALVKGGATVTASEEGAPRATVSGVRISVAEPRTVGTVPAGAVFASPSGTLCVFVLDTESAGAGGKAEGSDAVVLAEAGPLEGELAVTAVDADLVGAAIVRDPSRLSADEHAACA
jgi:peptidoglycan hydrolase-like protein with peptidoglycan-binding domain